MRKNRRFRPEIKSAILVIQFCLVTAGVFAQQAPEQYLTPAIVENVIANSESVSSAFDALENHQDEKVRRQYAEYAEQLNLFIERLSSFYDTEENYDIPKAYRKALQIHVPPAIKAVYLENGLGEQGHQALMCLYLSAMAANLKQILPNMDDSAISNKVKKQITIIEPLIRPQDLALIEEYFEELKRF